jgi:hypothetical protein
MFVCAVRNAAWQGTKYTARVVKYVFITRPLGLHSDPQRTLDTGAGVLLKNLNKAENKEVLNEGWVLVDEDPVNRGAIHQLLRTLNSKPTAPDSAQAANVTEGMVDNSLAHVTKIAEELNPEGADKGVEFVDANGVVFEEAYDQSVIYNTVDIFANATPQAEEDDFVMV